MSPLNFVYLTTLESTEKRETAILVDAFNVLPKQNEWFCMKIRDLKMQHVPRETLHDYRLMTYRFTTETLREPGARAVTVTVSFSAKLTPFACSSAILRREIGSVIQWTLNRRTVWCSNNLKLEQKIREKFGLKLE